LPWFLELPALMTPAGTRGVSLIDDLVREGARKMLAEALQAEVDDYIARHGGERDENGRRLVVRNGSHQPGRRGRPRHGLRRQVRRQSENARARPVTVEALREYLVRWDELKQEFGHAGQHLSCLPDGRPIHPDTITEWFARLKLGGRTAADPAARRPAQLRHGGAAGRRAGQGRQRSLGALVGFVHAGPLHARDPRDGRARCAGRGDHDPGAGGGLRDHSRDHRDRFAPDLNAHKARGPLTVLVSGPLA
jgi:hypothetical protein